MTTRHLKGRLRLSLSAIAVATVLAACQSEEDKARVVLSEALQSFQTVQDGTVPTVDRLSALDAVEAGLADIAATYPTTDVGLQLAGREPFGQLDPAALPEIRAALETERSVETCAEQPTVNCLRIVFERSLEERPPSNLDNDLVTPFVIAFLDRVPIPLIDVARQEMEPTFMPALLLGLGGQRLDRVEEFLVENARVLRVDPSSPRAGLLQFIGEYARIFVPTDEDTAIRRELHAMASAERDASQDVAAEFLAAMLANPSEIAGFTRWDDLSDQEFSEIPAWFSLEFAFSAPGSEQHEQTLTGGLSNYRDVDLDPARATEIALATLDRGRDVLKGELVWDSVSFGIADEVIAKAETFAEPLMTRGWWATALGARELGFRGDRETFDRILAVTTFGDDQAAGVTMAENNFAFGQALAGDIASLEARMRQDTTAPGDEENPLPPSSGEPAGSGGLDPTTIELARILQGVSPTDILSVFSYKIDQRLWGPVDENGLDRARLFVWADMSLSERVRIAKENTGIVAMAYERAASEDRATPDDLLVILNGLDVHSAFRIVTQLEDPAVLSRAAGLDSLPPEFLLAMMLNFNVIEDSLAAAQGRAE